MTFKQRFKILFDYAFTIFNLLVAISLLSGLFYIRFLPRVSRDLWENLTNYQLFITLFTIFCIIGNIYNTLKILGRIKRKEPPIWLHVYMYPLEGVYFYILAVLENFYGFIWVVLETVAKKLFHIKYLNYKVLLPLVRSFINPKYSIYYFIFLLGVKMLPIIILVLALVYDVIFCQHMDYTFRCIPLLLLTLLEPLIIFIFKRFYKRHLFNLVSYVIIEEIPGSTDFNYTLRVEEKDLPYGVKDFYDFYYNHLYPVDQILLTLEKYEAWKSETVPTYYIQLILQMLRLSAYVYILIYGII